MSNHVTVSVADFKRDFHRYATEVKGGGRILVTRHGRPVGEFVPASGVTASLLPVPRRPGGLLSVLGLFEDWESMEDDMAKVVAARRAAKERPAPDLG